MYPYSIIIRHMSIIFVIFGIKGKTMSPRSIPDSKKVMLVPDLEVTVPTSALERTAQSQKLLSTAGSPGSLAAPLRAHPRALQPPTGDSATAADGAASDAEDVRARKARARIYTEFIAAVLKLPSKKAKTGEGVVAMSSSDPVSAVAAAAAATHGMAVDGVAADGAEAPSLPVPYLYLNHDRFHQAWFRAMRSTCSDPLDHNSDPLDPWPWVALQASRRHGASARGGS